MTLDRSGRRALMLPAAGCPETNMPAPRPRETRQAVDCWAMLRFGLLVAVPAALAVVINGQAFSYSTALTLAAAGTVANRSYVCYQRRSL